MANTSSTVAAATGVLALSLAGVAIPASAAPAPQQISAKGKRVRALATLPSGRQLPIYNFTLSAGFGHSSGPHAGRRHAGQDFGAPTGTPLYASVAGRVKIAGNYGGYGKLVSIVTRGGGEQRYGHMSRILVRKGQRVRPGQMIGRVGSTGYSTGPHLHFEVRSVRGNACNPLKFLGVSRRTLVRIEHRFDRLRG